MPLDKEEAVWGWAVLYRFVIRQYYIYDQFVQLLLIPPYLHRLRPDSRTSSYASLRSDPEAPEEEGGSGAEEEGGGASCAEHEPQPRSA